MGLKQSSLNKSTVQTSSNFEMFAEKAQQFTVQRIVDICGFEYLAVELACDWLGLFCNFQPNSSQYSCWDYFEWTLKVVPVGQKRGFWYTQGTI